jgi:hypothetical protein
MRADSASEWDDHQRPGFIAPPPRKLEGFLAPDDGEPSPPPAPPAVRPKAHRFDTDLDLCEIDDRDRPGPKWTGRAVEVSRSHLVFRTRRMCYAGRRVLAAVHLVDAEPMPLAGRVYACEYDGDGLYKVGIDLEPVPLGPAIRAWLVSGH